MKKFIAILISLLVSFHSSVTLSADSSYHLDKAKINLDDEQSLQRGARNFINYCLNCHSANYMRYNRLADIGLSDDVIIGVPDLTIATYFESIASCAEFRGEWQQDIGLIDLYRDTRGVVSAAEV